MMNKANDYPDSSGLFDAGKELGQPELIWVILSIIGIIKLIILWWWFLLKYAKSTITLSNKLH